MIYDTNTTKDQAAALKKSNQARQFLGHEPLARLQGFSCTPFIYQAHLYQVGLSFLQIEKPNKPFMVL